MKKFLVGILIGIFIGWVTVGVAYSSDNDARTYKELLRKIISIVEQVQMTSKITADNTAIIANNTTAIRKKLGAE
jgi:gas vesicle protein